ncbi:protein of unknown function [Serratia sp. Tan611]|nr:protein of unknown function [Serratia sp. Tan611]
MFYFQCVLLICCAENNTKKTTLSITCTFNRKALIFHKKHPFYFCFYICFVYCHLRVVMGCFWF